MKKNVFTLLFFFIAAGAESQDSLAIYNKTADNNPAIDWLVIPVKEQAAVYTFNNRKDLVLYNGLVKKVFRLLPNVTCVDFKNLSNGQQLLRAVKPEARLTINGTEYNVGGLYGQQENAYLLPEWIDNFTDSSNDFHFVTYTISKIQPRLAWKPAAANFHPARPSGGVDLNFMYRAGAPRLQGLQVNIHYELYNGIPLIVKWLSIENKSNQSFTLDRVVNEIMALTEEESAVVGTPEQMKKQHGIYVETNYAFNNAMRYDISDQTTHWKADSAYTSQVNYNYQTPCLLEVYPERAPGIVLAPGDRLLRYERMNY